MCSPWGSYLVIEGIVGLPTFSTDGFYPGEDAGAYGLRLALRNGYLNLYEGRPALGYTANIGQQSRMAVRKSMLVVNATRLSTLASWPRLVPT